MNTARWRMPWKSLKTETDGPEEKLPREPVGYLVNHRRGVRGLQGVGYDYVLAGPLPGRPGSSWTACWRWPDWAGTRSTSPT